MHRKIVLGVLLSVFLWPALFEIGPPGLAVMSSSSNIISVPDDYQTIQEAINAANPGDSVQVAPGTYYEHVIVSKSLALTGDKGSTILDGNGTGSIIRISADGVNVTGFTVQNGVYGIYLNNSSDCTIHDNHAINNSNSISLWYSHGNTIRSNDVENSVAGISLYYSNSNIINDNRVANNSWHGIAAWYYSEDNVINGNTITHNAGNGILLYLACNKNTLGGNRISNNANNGVYLFYSSYNTIGNNSVSENDRGILIRESSHNSINNNTASNQVRYAIYVDFASDNKIEGNNLVNNAYGVQVFNSNGNTIYHNNIISNEKQVEQQQSTNAWDTGADGNYWSDYTGVDANGDGIGDTPYIIDENDKDRYPLMSRWIPLPLIVIVSPSNNSETRSAVFSITWIGIDKGSGIDHYEVRLDGGLWTAVGMNTTYTFRAVNEGSHKIEVKVADKTGRSQVTSINFTVNTSPLGGPGYIEEAAIFTAIALATLATIVYFFKIRKKSRQENRRPEPIASACPNNGATANVGHAKR